MEIARDNRDEGNKIAGSEGLIGSLELFGGRL